MDKKTRNKMQKNILWVDLEMTGLDTEKDKILEVAAIVTDWKFKEIATYEAAIKVDDKLAQERMFNGAAAEFWNGIPETRDALIKQNKEIGQPCSDVEDQLIALLDEHFEDGVPIILAGNSIHMDRKFIENEWSRLNRRLHYRMLDVSAWKVVFEGRYKKKFAKPEVHRALDDIRGSIEELSYYLTKFKKP